MAGRAEGTDASSRRWLFLALGLLAQVSTCVFLYGLPVLVPALREPGEISGGGLSLAAAGGLIAAPSVGLLLTLIAWGAAADRFGERWVITIGLALAAAAILAGALSHGYVAVFVWWVVGGAAAASVNAASGRMVIGWFSVGQRGLAMGVRQTAQPLGVGLAAILLPSLAHSWGALHALLVTAGMCAVSSALVGLFVVDPPRPARSPRPPRPARSPQAVATVHPSPYRGSALLWRIHASSAALVVPQFAISGYTLVYLVGERDWSTVAAGRLVFALQLAGAAGRIGAGVWSDLVGSRLRPMRQLAVASAGLMLAAALCDLGHLWAIVIVFALAAIVTVADNGLAYTSVAELAGPYWAGRALGAQNTGQNVTAALTPPLLGAVVQTHGYALGFALVAVFPIIAIIATPVGLSERTSRKDSVSA